uniref:Uncharacterized protein n=1 Tax=Oryza punctata TaxID=4537 RepID=A0A0E0KMH4_ORYPU
MERNQGRSQPDASLDISVKTGYTGYVYNFYKGRGREQPAMREKLINPEKLPRIKHPTSFDDEGIKNRELCYFIQYEYCHQEKLFFDLEGNLAMSEEYKSLIE